MKKKLIVLLATAALAASLAACGGGSSASTSSASAKSEPAAAASSAASSAAASSAAESASEVVEASVTETEAAEPAGGFQEYEIWADEEVGFMNVNGVYFQPVPMSGGNENYEDYDLHFEADVAALEDNGLGYGPGDWIPYLTVDYEISGSDGSVVAEGTFMPMSADDGPHYGANIKLGDADTLSVKLTFHSPEENGYIIHLDDETGPGGVFDDYFADGPLVLELKDVWDYVPQEW